MWKNDEDTLRKSPSLTTLNAYLIKNQTITCPIKSSWRGEFTCARSIYNFFLYLYIHIYLLKLYYLLFILFVFLFILPHKLFSNFLLKCLCYNLNLTNCNVFCSLLWKCLIFMYTATSKFINFSFILTWIFNTFPCLGITVEFFNALKLNGFFFV